MPKLPKYIYKLMSEEQFLALNEAPFDYMQGSDLDKRDGYLHLSLAEQVKYVAQKYFADLKDGHLLEIATEGAENLKWEPNSKGELFLHAYGTIDYRLVNKVYPFNTHTFDYDQLTKN